MSDINLRVISDEDGERWLEVLRVPEGQFRLALQRAVEAAIREYPNERAEWWLGGVAAIRVVEQWIIDHTESS